MKFFKKKTASSQTIFFLLLIILINLFVLDFFFIKNNLLSFTNILGISTFSSESCPKSCLDQFSTYSVSTGVSAKEYFIPLGTGTNSSVDWEDVAGVQASIDSAQYPKIKKAVFESTIQVPTGNQKVWIRLFNKTDKHPVWFSEMTTSGAGPNLLNSDPIKLDPGNKLYQVQMKTQLQYPANLNQARIHLVIY